jgi:hypothetical protein
LRGVDPARVFSDETWDLQVIRVARIPQPTPGLRLVNSVALWKTGRPEEARNTLRALSQATPASTNAAKAGATDDALGVLLLTGLHEPLDEANARSRGGDTGSFYLLAALARHEDPAHPLIPSNRRDLVAQLTPFVRQIFP